MNALTGSIHVPDKVSEEEAMRRTTHLAIGAHPDDLEIFAYHGIEVCYRNREKWFGGVTVTDGAGCPGQSKEDREKAGLIQAVRRREQIEAANIGEYSFQCQLGYTSDAVKDYASSRELVTTLTTILERCPVEVLYLHNPADKHPTHLAVLQRCVEAIRNLPKEKRPLRVLGCEVWRGLDWLRDSDKVILPVDRHPELARKLIEVFKSQIEDSKDYVRATLGRRYANATFLESHAVDAVPAYIYTMDLKPLMENDHMTLADLLSIHLDHFREDVLKSVQLMNPNPNES